MHIFLPVGYKSTGVTELTKSDHDYVHFTWGKKDGYTEVLISIHKQYQFMWSSHWTKERFPNCEAKS